MAHPTLSVVLAVHNEAAHLARCLEAVKDLADEIIIVDGASTDDTVKIASKYTQKIIHTTNKLNFHINKNLGLDAATCDWTLQLDADEVVSPELAAQIRQVLPTTPLSGFWLNRKNWFLYRFLTKGGQYPDPTLRLYKTGLGKLPAKDVHEQAQVNGETGHLKADLLHYRDTSFEKYLSGFNRYSTFISTQLATQKVSFNVVSIVNYLLIKPLVTFLKLFVRHRGYVDGMAGFIFALYSGLIHPVAYIKYWQSTLPHA